MLNLKISSFLLLLLIFSSCFLRENHFSKAQRFLRKGFCKKAHQSFLQTSLNKRKHIEFAYQAADFCLNKKAQAQEALSFYETLYFKFSRTSKILKQQDTYFLEQQIANLSFKPLNKYNKAIKYYKKILKTDAQPKQKIQAQYRIAESFFYLQKWEQASKEVAIFFKQELSLKDKQPAFILKGRLLIHQKKWKEASRLFKDLINKYPLKQNFFREYLALVYEEQKKFTLAIEEMEKIEPSSSFVKTKIQQLYQRLENQPEKGK